MSSMLSCFPLSCCLQVWLSFGGKGVKRSSRTDPQAARGTGRPLSHLRLHVTPDVFNVGHRTAPDAGSDLRGGALAGARGPWLWLQGRGSLSPGSIRLHPVCRRTMSRQPLLITEAPRTTWLSTHSQRGRGFSSPAAGGGCGLLMAELAVCPRAHVVPATAGASSGEGHSRCPCEWPSVPWLEQTQVSPWHWGGLVSPNALTGRAGVSLSSRREGGECGSGCGRPRKSANRSSSGSPAGKRCRASHI